MNTDQLKFSLMCWQGDYDSVHDKEQYDLFGAAINAVNRLQDAQKRIAELENNETCQRLANAEHVIYMKDLAIHNILASRRAQFKKRLDAQKRIAELEANDRMNQQARDELLARAIEAEDELARRDALDSPGE